VKQTILARRYAKALFSLGKDEGKFEEYNDTLSALAELYQQAPEVRDGLTNPIYPLEARRKVMTAIADSAKADAMLTRFLGLLIDKKRADILPDIAFEMQAMVDKEKNISHGSVISAVELDDALKEKIQATLEKITGKKVLLETTVDPSILGGIIAKVGDIVLDGSIRTQLSGLKDTIKGSE